MLKTPDWKLRTKGGAKKKKKKKSGKGEREDGQVSQATAAGGTRLERHMGRPLN